MRLAIMGAVIGATLVGALPASAEVVIRAGEGGVAIHERDGYRHRDEYRGHRRWHRAYAECRVVRERIVTPSGRVIIRTHRRC
jgi:hypothetical protein